MRRPVAALLAIALMLGVGAIAPALSSASAPRATLPYTPVKGIAILINNANAVNDAQAVSIANSIFSTISTKFHCNGVSLDFPYWQSSSVSNVPEAASMTPTPQRLALLTAVAHKYHLSVEWRPYLYEGDLTKNSRVSIKPRNPTLWISNYSAFLQPYLIAASESGATSFSFALELTTLMPYLSAWTTAIQKAKSLYPGTLFYSQQHQPMISLPLLARGYDAYQPIALRSPAFVSVATFTNGFIHNFQLGGMQETPADLTVEELGIAAVSGAYNRPYYEHYPAKTKIDRTVQEDWFQGACNAFWTLHLQGIYFWAIGFDNWSPSENNNKNFYAWYNTPTQNVVANCFARTS